MSDSVWPHRQQPTRLPRPWDSPGKNTGVGCHFLLQSMKVKHESETWKWSRSVMSDPQQPHGLQPTRLLHPWDFPGKSTGIGCHCLLHLGLPKHSLIPKDTHTHFSVWAARIVRGCKSKTFNMPLVPWKDHTFVWQVEYRRERPGLGNLGLVKTN